jgi:translation elongation factor EF-1beta
VIAKSSVLLDVKVWDDETNMTELEEKVRSINLDGLVWGSSKLVPVAYNIKKLQIQCVIEDDKVKLFDLHDLFIFRLSIFLNICAIFLDKH